MNYVHKLLLEGEAGCLMLKVGMSDAEKILAWSEENIPDSELADDGREREIHTTAAFGFTPDVTDEEVFDAVTKITGNRVIPFQLLEISRFDTNPKYDVIKVAVDSTRLRELNAGLQTVFGERLTSTFEFNPHLTLAYVKKGALPKLNGHCQFMGDVYLGRDLVYSTPGRVRKTELVLGESLVLKLLQ